MSKGSVNKKKSDAWKRHKEYEKEEEEEGKVVRVLK
jgi:hypothetical protein